MRTALFCIAISAWPALSHGTQEFIAPWSEVAVVATVEGVPVRGEAKAQNNRITLLSLEVKGQKIVVPPSEYADLIFPQLHTFRIVYIPTNGKETWSAGITFYYGDPRQATDDSDLNDAKFGFSETKYELRWTRERISPDTWQHYQKVPGQAAEKMGVERAIGSVK
jgi:hypothetical protein